VSAWGHALRRLTERERGTPGSWASTCSAGGRPRCEQPTLFAFTYSYVTGRRGRVSWAQKNLCHAHAERAAKRYQLALPAEAAEGPRHARELAIEQLLGGEKA
jgi:hypothetical protein